MQIKPLKKGIVYRSTGSWYVVESEGVFYSCRIKGKLRLEGIQSTNPIAVGDRVFLKLMKKPQSQRAVLLR